MSPSRTSRLDRETLGRLDGDTIALPSFDRGSLKPSVAHLGVGAFHRCHQAEYADDLLTLGAGPWSIVGINLRAPDLMSSLGEQNGLYCRELRENGAIDRRIIGSIAQVHSVLSEEYDPRRLTLEKAFEVVTDPDIQVVTMTVTEKGYCHQPATGAFDPKNVDIVHDVGNPRAPRSVPGFLLEAIRRRSADGTRPFTVVCCDNVPDNGSTMRRSVLGLAELVCPEDVEAIANSMHFLNTMVDRIVPATRGEDIEAFASQTGLRDEGLVVGEPFRMWVVENPRNASIPPWEQVGALVVDDVVPYEILKMRVVNGVQSNLCQLGLLAGFEFMADVMATSVFRDFARQTIEQEVAPNLPAVPGIDTQDYIETAFKRLTNPDLKHRTAQISTDGSQKIKQRLLQPIRDALAKGTDHDGLLLGVAGWIVYAGGKSWDGQTHTVNDPVAGRMAEAYRLAEGDPGRLVRAVLGIDHIFGHDLRETDSIVMRLTEHVKALQTQPTVEVVAALLRQPLPHSALRGRISG